MNEKQLNELREKLEQIPEHGSQGWLIEDWLPIGHKGQDISVEGSFKTTLGCWCVVSVAAGKPIFGHEVKQGSVLVVDEETPEPDLHNWLQRFALGLGLKSWRDLPITVKSKTGFRFSRKTELDRILKEVQRIQPVFIRIDSFIACVPGGREGMGENNAEVGIAVRDDLNRILEVVPDSAILLAAHAKKFVGELGLNQMKMYEIGSLVRGHGSIVGEACDTAIILKKISEHPEPTRFLITTKARRRAIPMVAHDVYVELREQEYGKGWARLEEIDPVVLPPSKLACDLYPLFSKEPIKASHIVKKAALHTKKELREGIEELSQRKAIIPSTNEPFSYELNPSRQSEVEKSYLSKLEASRPAPKP
jgi:hypothetical protein